MYKKCSISNEPQAHTKLLNYPFSALKMQFVSFRRIFRMRYKVRNCLGLKARNYKIRNHLRAKFEVIRFKIYILELLYNFFYFVIFRTLPPYHPLSNLVISNFLTFPEFLHAKSFYDWNMCSDRLILLPFKPF